ncbi:hypothetical protein LTR13_009822 [Exophiala sideris]|nr:hypothetical protein LTR13_009822 [Exophiala sideris]KAK5178220.1 hypothetical protein LTR44_009304 [Eurotiomycetes sp. CCFEE 6388]
MDTIKSLLNKEVAEDSNKTNTSARLTGQGSHFHKDDQSEPSSSGYVQGTDARQPTGPTSNEELGTVAIGGTSTYRKHHLPKGDTVGSVIDPTSTDPTTYKMPEHTYQANTGVPAGSAGTAATLAFRDLDPTASQIPGAFPGDESLSADSTRGDTSATTGSAGYGSSRERFGTTGDETSTREGAGYGSSTEPFGTTGTQDETAGGAGYGTSREQFGSTGRQDNTVGGSGYGTSREQFGSAGRQDNTVGGSGYGTSREPLGTTGVEGAAAGYEASREPFGTTGGETTTSGDAGYGTSREPFGTTGGETVTGGHGGYGSSREPFSSTGAQDATAGNTGSGTSGKPFSFYNATTVGDSDLGNTSSTADRSIGSTTAAGETSNSGTFGKILGAVGLGGAAGGAGAAASRAGERDQVHTQSQPTTTTGVDSYTAPTQSGTSATSGQSASSTGRDSYGGRTQSGPSSSHYRKESIPTTAYPAGINSPSPINPPVGGTTEAVDDSDRHHHTGRDAGLAAAGIGAGALGAHEYERNRPQRDDSASQSAPRSTGQTTSTAGSYAPATTSSGLGRDTTNIGENDFAAPYDTAGPGPERDTGYGRTAGAAGRGAGADPARPAQDDRHLGRDAAIAGVAGTGAAAYGVHDHDKDRAEPSTQSQQTGQYGSGRDAYGSAPTTQSSQGNQYGSGRDAYGSGPTTQSSQGTQHVSGDDVYVPTSQRGQDERHYGRDAAIAGAAGTGAVGAYEYESHRPEQTTSSGRDVYGSEPTTQSSQGNQYGSGRDAYGSEPITQRGQDSRHYGRDAAVAGAAGTGAAGAYEYERHRPEQTTGTGRDAYGSEPSSQGNQYGSGRDNYGSDSTAQRGQDDRHYGRDAAVAGAAGTGAVGAYEYEKHRPEQTTSYGRDVSGSEPTTHRGQGDRHYGRDAAVAGAAGTGAYEYEKHRPEQTNTYGRDVSGSDPTTQSSQGNQYDSGRVGYGNEPASQRGQDDRHLGRDAAVAGAAGTGAYEYEKHRPEQATGVGREDPATSTRDTRTAAPASEKATSRQQATEPEKEQRHTGRDAALAGATGAGAGALGEHEYSKHEAEKAEAQRQKDLAEQEAARQKQFEKDQKAAEKQAHKEEKQHAKLEKKIQKEHEKDEKQHHKELEKEEKHHDKEAAGAAAAGTGAAAYGVDEHDKKRDNKNLTRDEQALHEPHSGNQQRRHEAESLGTGAYPGGERERNVTSEDTDRTRLHKDPPQQKKEGFFKRIFKSRKNKDTGEDEDYSTDEEDTTHHHRGAEAAGVGGAGLAAAEADRHHERNAVHGTAGTAGQHAGQSSYEAQSGGLQKPSYNPFSKQDPTVMDVPTTSNRTADTNLGTGVGTNQYDTGYETRPGETGTGTRS